VLFDAIGSSPRVRGTRQGHDARVCLGRFIPACAGNTHPTKTRQPSAPVHPRVCGEHDHPPRPDGRAARFIPACAGNTNASTRSLAAFNGSSPRVRGTRSSTTPGRAGGPVHPRVCGEHHSGASIPPSRIGSSPRVRGTQGADRVVEVQVRFIPACAGNTPRRGPQRSKAPVHPRVCGEHPDVVGHVFPQRGSSPRVRGTRGAPAIGHAVYRFIPACAGNTRGSSDGQGGAPVHPRVCGEHPVQMRLTVEPLGSSPRVRGTRAPAETPVGEGRFIPACAGNTADHKGALCPLAVHPRVCGEHIPTSNPVPPTTGSSPRVRGTPEQDLQLHVVQRFIPACAGNTLAVGD